MWNDVILFDTVQNFNDLSETKIIPNKGKFGS